MSLTPSNSVPRPICPFCKKQYSRPDALRRHAATCPKNTLRTPLPRGIRGRGPQACDFCAQRGSFCDKQDPCGRCSSRRIVCLYTRRITRVVANHLVAGGDVEGGRVGEVRGSSRTSLLMLLNVTNPSIQSVTDALAVKVAKVEDERLEHCRRGGHLVFEVADVGLGTTRPCDAAGDEPVEQAGGAENDTVVADAADDLQVQLRSKNLAMRLESLVLLLSKSHESMCTTNASESPTFDMDLARSTFTADNFVDFTSSFFRRAHQIFPLIHRPSFDPDTVSLPLLVAVFVAGAAFSPPWDHVLAARRFVCVAEHYVYQCLHDLIMRAAGDGQHTIETLQAALVVQSIQFHDNDTEIRRRMRIQRHPTLVAALRMLDLANLGGGGGELSRPVNWADFVAREIRIRLVAWTFHFDCLSTIFFNVSPQLTLADMVGPMMCSEQLFEATSAAAFQRLLSVEPARTCSLQTLVSSFYDDRPCGAWDAHLSETDLLLVIHALHQTHFLSRTCGLEPVTRHAMRRAITRWKGLWDAWQGGKGSDVQQQQQQQHHETQSRCMAFMCDAYEFWWLLVNITKAVEAGRYGHVHLRNMATDSSEGVRDFILTHGDR